MKSALIFVTLISFVLANDLFLGEWKEDQSKRQNLNDFLWARGMLGFIVLTHRGLVGIPSSTFTHLHHLHLIIFGKCIGEGISTIEIPSPVPKRYTSEGKH